jgi:hypothetical protein
MVNKDNKHERRGKQICGKREERGHNDECVEWHGYGYGRRENMMN